VKARRLHGQPASLFSGTASGGDALRSDNGSVSVPDYSRVPRRQADAWILSAGGSWGHSISALVPDSTYPGSL